MSEELNKKLESGDHFSMNDIASLKDTLHDYFNVHIDDDNMLEYSNRYVDRYTDFKRRGSLVDFNDVILNTVDDSFDDDRLPSFEVLIIDEAQDLSFLQWQMVKSIWNKSKEVYLAGDDDQAIMGFQGANPTHFIRLHKDENTTIDESLVKSRRVPRQVLKFP